MSTRQKNSNVTYIPNSGQPNNWQRIDWPRANREVAALQEEIVMAWQRKEYGKVKEQQDKLVNSFSACCIAVKKVTTNPGKKTPGIDKILWDTPQARMDRVHDLFNLNFAHYKAKPVKRVGIPKPNGKQRPLGIPTMMDRRTQTIWRQRLAPIAECTGELNSYGFRSKRSTQDAAQTLYLRQVQKYSPDWVLEADIKGFYDNLNHKWMLQHIPLPSNVQNQWQKAGILEKGEFAPSEAGVPQGGPISPIIANMCQDGLEKHIQEATSEHDKKWAPKVTTVRYADDFVVTGATPRLLIYRVKPAIEEFLKERGLELHSDKTVQTNVHEGFDFLGFNFKYYKTHTTQRGYTLFIKPSNKSMKNIKAKVKAVVKDAGNNTPEKLIREQNPILRGWSNYFHTVVRSQKFKALDRYCFLVVWNWCKRKARGGKMSSLKVIKDKYFKSYGGNNWTFFGNTPSGKEVQQFNLKKVTIRRHHLVQDLNPFQKENQKYFNTRRNKIGLLSPYWSWLHNKLFKQVSSKKKLQSV